MKSILLLASVLGGSLVVGVSNTTSTDKPIPRSTSVAQPVLYWGVRAEYVARDRVLGQIDTELIIQNTSARWSLRLMDIVVLGRHGLLTTLKIHKGLNGGYVPPLGQVVVPINRSIGVTAGNHNAPSPNDVASVVVQWDGRGPDQMKLTAVIKQWEPSNSSDGHFGTLVEESYRVTFN